MRKVRRSVSVLAAAAVAAAPAVAGVAAPRHARPPSGFWMRGDLHVHTIYGHDTCITPQTAWDYTKPDRGARRDCPDAYTVGYAPADRLSEAKNRGLDFVALTDHNNVMNQSDPDVLAWEAANPRFVVVPGYENSQPGHVQMLGATACYDNEGPIAAVVECDAAVTDKTAPGEQRLADALRADGGVFQINHPSDGNWDTAFQHQVVPDTVEVWNIGPWAYQHPFPASNDNDFSLRWYDDFLKAGAHVAATGGSDSHWVTTDAVQGVGDPTTWVFVHERSIAGVLEGLREHRTFVSALPPAENGPQLYLDADGNRDRIFEAVVGSETTPSATYRVRTVDAVAGSVVRVVTDTGSAQLLLPPNGQLTFRPGAGGVPRARTFVRVELLAPDAKSARTAGCDPVVGSGTTICRDDLAMEALTSPIYVR